MALLSQLQVRRCLYFIALLGGKKVRRKGKGFGVSVGEKSLRKNEISWVNSSFWSFLVKVNM